MIHPDTVELIIDRAQVDEVIGDYISLKKSGSNYKGCCPFHDEKTPSFMVSPSKGIYKCFGCGKGGNSVSFVMEHDKLSYADALRQLAKKYNIEIVEKELNDEEKQRKSVRESLQVVNNFATDFFKYQLHQTNEGKSVGLSYFKERGFTEQTIEKFQLGYSPEGFDAFSSDAEKNGHKIEYLEKTGLTILNDTKRYDRFRGRVMFPIHSLSGNVIGFGGRIMKTDPDKKFAKYLNSPESEVYNKSKTLYGIYYARQAMSQKDQCILVEGYTDVMSMHQSGIENVVASSGTSLTVDQINLIKRFTRNILVIFDGDNAGIKASIRGINMILEQGLSVKTLSLPEGDDPDSFAQKHSEEELVEYINKNQTNFISFKTKLYAEETKNDPIERAKMINEIVHTISLIPDQIERSVFISTSSKDLGISEEVLNSQVAKLIGDKIAKEQSRVSYKQHLDRQQGFQSPPPDLHNPFNPGPVTPPQLAPKQVKSSSSYTESEILYILLLYGLESVILPIEETEIIVKDYIYTEVVEGDMEFIDEKCKLIFDEYYLKVKDSQDAIQKILVNSENLDIQKQVVDIISADKTLSNFWSQKESYTETEKDKLPYVLWITVSEYKKRRLQIEEKELLKKLQENLSSEEMSETLKFLMEIKQNISSISKDLKHVS